MLNIDLFFTYKYNLRFLLINKLGYLNNTYNIPSIKKLILYVPLKRLEDIDEVQIYNNFYLFKFFLGRKAYFTKTKKFFSLGKWYYNFNINIIINNNKDIYLLLYYIFNNVFFNVEKNLLNLGFVNKFLNIFFFVNKDINIYSDLKTNLGLFNIKAPLNINLYLLGVDNISKVIYIKNLYKLYDR